MGSPRSSPRSSADGRRPTNTNATPTCERAPPTLLLTRLPTHPLPLRYEDQEIIQLLIQRGASLALRDRRGRRAVDFAMQSESPAVKELLGLGGDRGNARAMTIEGRKQRRRGSVVNLKDRELKLFEARIIPSPA